MTSASLCAQLGIDEVEISQRLELLDFSPQDEGALEPVTPLLRANAAYLANEFYERLRQFPELQDFLADEQRLSRGRTALAEHLRLFARQVSSRRYFERRLRVAAEHVRSGIVLAWYLAAHAHLWTTLSRIVVAHFGPAPAAGLLVRLHKLFALELVLEIEAFHLRLLSGLADGNSAAVTGMDTTPSRRAEG